MEVESNISRGIRSGRESPILKESIFGRDGGGQTVFARRRSSDLMRNR